MSHHSPQKSSLDPSSKLSSPESRSSPLRSSLKGSPGTNMKGQKKDQGVSKKGKKKSVSFMAPDGMGQQESAAKSEEDLEQPDEKKLSKKEYLEKLLQTVPKQLPQEPERGKRMYFRSLSGQHKSKKKKIIEGIGGMQEIPSKNDENSSSSSNHKKSSEEQNSEENDSDYDGIFHKKLGKSNSSDSSESE